MGSYARVVMFDKRGTGMSDRVAELPGLDQDETKPGTKTKLIEPSPNTWYAMLTSPLLA
jgi:hypothetical protein